MKTWLEQTQKLQEQYIGKFVNDTDWIMDIESKPRGQTIVKITSKGHRGTYYVHNFNSLHDAEAFIERRLTKCEGRVTLVCPKCLKKTVEPDLCGKQNDVCWLCGNCGYSLPNVEVQEFEASLTV